MSSPPSTPSEIDSSQLRRRLPRLSTSAQPTYNDRQRYEEMGVLPPSARPSLHNSPMTPNTIDVLGSAAETTKPSTVGIQDDGEDEDDPKPTYRRSRKTSAIIHDDDDDDGEDDTITLQPGEAQNRKPAASTLALVARMGYEAPYLPFDAFQAANLNASEKPRAKATAHRPLQAPNRPGKKNLASSTADAIAARRITNKEAAEQARNKAQANLAKRKAEIQNEMAVKKQRVLKDLEDEHKAMVKAEEEESREKVRDYEEYLEKDLKLLQDALNSPKGK